MEPLITIEGAYLGGAIPGKLCRIMPPTANSSQKAPVLALTREETARALGLSAFTIDRLAARGILNPSRATRRPLYPICEIERFLRDTAANPPAPLNPAAGPV